MFVHSTCEPENCVPFHSNRIQKCYYIRLLSHLSVELPMWFTLGCLCEIFRCWCEGEENSVLKGTITTKGKRRVRETWSHQSEIFHSLQLTHSVASYLVSCESGIAMAHSKNLGVSPCAGVFSFPG